MLPSDEVQAQRDRFGRQRYRARLAGVIITLLLIWLFDILIPG